jgi:hypothetical protein
VENIRQTTALIIWWCEGTKPRKDRRWKNAICSPIEVTNSNPKIIKIFIDFLRFDLGVNLKDLHGQLQIHEGDDKEEIETFWETVTGIAKSQFNKTIIRKIGNKPGKNKGTFKVRIYNISLFKRLSLLLEEELEKIENRGIAQMARAYGLGP